MAQFYRPKSKKSSTTRKNCQLQIEQLELHGKGVGFINRRPVFVDGALPGETINVSLLTSGKKQDARLIDVLTSSAERVQPACSIYARCGGCQLQHLQAEAQIRYKQQALKDYLHRKGIEVEQWEAPICSAPLGYRRKARLAIDARKHPVTIGFRQEKSSRITDIDTCLVLSPLLNEALQTVRGVLQNDAQASAVGYVDLIDTGTHANVFFWLQPTASPKALQYWQTRLANCGDNLHVAKAHLTQQAELYYPLEGLNIGFAANHFIQVNDVVNQQMVAQAMRWLELKPNDNVLDLFCGVGNFSLPIAARCEQVTGVEGVPEMVEQASRNAAANALFNVQFTSADLSKVGWSQSLSGPFNKVLLDPARAGAEQVALEIGALKADSLLYVSCHPATLVRDALHICKSGYRVVKAGVMDMFPQTQHVESMMLFKKH